MKKLFTILLILLSIVLLFGCQEEAERKEALDPNKITIVATLFPQYDFARELAGDKANILLLLPPGMESHSYEPTPGDIITIQESDIFLYTGDEMEPWVSGIAANIGESPLVADLSQGITLCEEEHAHEEEEGHGHETDHHHEFNPHIWTSPVLAMQMVKNVEQALITADPANAEFYHSNAASYLEKLGALDQEFRTVVENSAQDTVYIGSRFSLYYFMEEYGLSHIAAYDSCEEEAEPSIKRVISMIEEMKSSGVKAIYYEELTEPYIANTIAESADAEALLFHSCHNVSKDELNEGATYLSLMKQNVENLKKGLNQ